MVSQTESCGDKKNVDNLVFSRWRAWFCREAFADVGAGGGQEPQAEEPVFALEGKDPRLRVYEGEGHWRAKMARAPTQRRAPVFPRFRWLPGRVLPVFFATVVRGTFCQCLGLFRLCLRTVHSRRRRLSSLHSNTALAAGRILSAKSEDCMMNGCQEHHHG